MATASKEEAEAERERSAPATPPTIAPTSPHSKRNQCATAGSNKIDNASITQGEPQWAGEQQRGASGIHRRHPRRNHCLRARGSMFSSARHCEIVSWANGNACRHLRM